MRLALIPLALAALLGACARPAAPPAAAPSVAAPSVTVASVDTADERWSLYDLPSAWRDQTGAALRLPALAGKVRVVAMVYTSCHATCPLIVADLKRIEASIPAARRDAVGFVLVSLDPERDTPGRLAEWAARTQLDPSRWTLLAGDDGAVRELSAALGVRYQAQADGEVAHTNAITVLDAAGAVAHQQPGLGDPAGATVAAVRHLLP